MASSPGSERVIHVPSASRQIGFHQLLVAARKTWLRDALLATLKRVDPKIVKGQLRDLAPEDVQQMLASSGIRDEFVLPVPALLEAEPTLVGYYRLVLGIPRKGFYRTGTGLAQFQSMEKRGTITARQRDGLPHFCRAMIEELSQLVRQSSPQITMRDIDELPLLTLGSMLQGANNVKIGEEAKQNVFATIREIVKGHITAETSSSITVRNAAGRTVVISFGADPDICLREKFESGLRSKVAIEIKGGGDVSNAHNRAGEAEKSHQKAKALDFRDFWTLISTRGLDVKKLKKESPTTTSWFDVPQILAREGDDWESFRSRLRGELGLRES